MLEKQLRKDKRHILSNWHWKIHAVLELNVGMLDLDCVDVVPASTPRT